MSKNSLSEPIAIVGMACRLPGVETLDQFWNLIHSGSHAITPIPPDRLNRERYFDPQRGQICKTYSDLGGLVNYRPFDRRNCPISEDVIEQVDVAHLTLLEVAAEACRDAGYDPFHLPSRKIGVFVGHTGGSPLVSDYLYSTVVEEGAAALDRVAELRSLGLDVNAIRRESVNQVRRRYRGRQPKQKLRLGALVGAELISESFDLDGPCGVVDAACASSLQALSLGVRSLLLGRLDATLVGGASYCKSDSLVLFSAAQSVSSQGSCPFSREADGLITAEGYVVFMLKTLSRAVRDGDKIQALIAGLGVSTDGRGKSLWAPRADGQILAVERAYAGDMDANRLQYIEAHATSTQVGDATELQALNRSLGNMLRDGHTKIPIGSVKGNIGHTLETAGVAGLLKTVLAMKRQIIPPAVRFRELNSEIDWNQCPFYIPFEPQPWSEYADGHPRRAAVNSFGIGGLNVHIVVDEYQPAESTTKRTFSVPAVTTTNLTPNAKTAAEPIAIIGMGCILPGAHTIDAFWNMLRSGQHAKINAPANRISAEFATTDGQPHPWRTYNLLGGFIEGWEYDWRRHKIPPKQIAQANPLQFMLLDAADQAFQNAGLDAKAIQGLLTSVIVGTIFGGDFSDQLQMGLRLPEFRATLREVLLQEGAPADRIPTIEEEFQRQLLTLMPALLDETGSFTSSTLASRITKSFNLMGGALALDAGNNSAALVIQAAIDQLRLGHAEMVVCAAGQRSMDLWTYEGLSLAEILARGESRSGLDAKSVGVIPGEGCGVILLKRLSDAQRDGNPIRGVIRGIHSSSHTDPEQAVRQASSSALAEAGLPASAVMSIESCAIRDEQKRPVELQGLIATYAETDRPSPVTFGDVTSQIGHTGGASAMAAIIKATLAAQTGELPPTLNVDQPHEAIALAPSTQTASVLTKLPTVPDSEYRATAVSSVHGRIAYHIITDNGVPRPAFAPITTTAHTTVPVRMIRFGAENSVALRNLLSHAQIDVDSTWRAIETDFGAQHARCTILAFSAAELGKKLSIAAEMIGKNRHDIAGDQGIFFATELTPPPVVAFLFPGQGSQYTGMTKGWCESDVGATTDLQYADEMMRRHGWMTFADLAWNANNSLGKEVWTTQAALLLADWLTWRVADRLGLRPAFVAGHSFGEFPALVAAEAWTLEEAMLATRARCDAVVACNNGETMMLSLSASREVVESMLRDSRREVWLCAENGPEQCVVGGALTEIQSVAEICSQRRIRSKALAVPCAFHTPLLAGSSAALASALQRRELQSPRVRFASTTFPCFLSESIDLRASLVRQMTHPVEFVATIRRLVEAGANTFIEMGPSQVLSQLTQRIAPDVANYRMLALDVPARPDHVPALRLQAACEAWGISLKDAHANSSRPLKAPLRNADSPSPVRLVDATQRRRQRLRDKASQVGEKKVARDLNLSTASPSNGKHSITDVAPAAVMLPRVTKPTARMEDSTGRLVIDVLSVHRISAATPPVAETPWMEHVRKADDFLEDLSECFSLDDQQLRQLRETPTLGGLVEILEHCPGKSDWLESRQRSQSLSAPMPTLDLEAYLIDFVVAQTGYPPEIVELDADLEADLGIDSIKKAQLFGEVGERFQLSADPNMSLDDFPTLGHVLSYLRKHVPDDTSSGIRPGSATRNPQVGSSTTASSVTRQGAATALLDPPDVEQAPESLPRVKELERFLIDFVVEQTGYPPEIVELDADLEADLGIDSIKKAQLFGEIGNQFQLSADPNLSLDDFSTLRHVLDYLLLQPTLNNLTGSQPLNASTPVVKAEAKSAAANSVTLANEAHGLQSFLVNFVVEQTGYPLEIIELDADMEADLGIDSIKKAQLFGEIGNHFQLRADPHLSLDDFPTLRHVYDYLTRHLSNGDASSTSEAVVPSTGEAFNRGFVHGRTHREAIGALLRRQAAQPSQSDDNKQWLAELTAEEHDELSGITAGAEVLFENLLAWQNCLDSTSYPCASRLLPVELSNHTGGAASCWASVGAKLCLDRTEQALFWRVPGQLGATAGINCCGFLLAASSHGVEHNRNSLPLAIRLRRLLVSATTTHDTIARDILWLTTNGNSTQTASVPVRSESLLQLQKHLENEPNPGWCDHHSLRLDGLPTYHGLQLIVVNQTAWVRNHNNAHLQNGTALWEAIELPFILPTSSAVPVAKLTKQLPPPTFPLGPRITQRYLPRLVPAIEQTLTTPEARPQSAIILGDAIHAHALAAKLQSWGLKTQRISQRLPWEQIEQQLNLHLSALPGASLILALDQAKPLRDQQQWKQAAQELLLSPFKACQLWLQQPAAASPRTLLASVSLGGSFGLEGGEISPCSGGLCGLLKGIRNECPQVIVRVVDLAADIDPNQMGTTVATEFLGSDRETEIAWSQRGRRCLRYEQKPVSGVAHSLPQAGEQWVITGGARGITGHVAKALAERYGIELQLLGTTPIETVEQRWLEATDEELKTLRGQVMIAAKKSGSDPIREWNKLEKTIEIQRQLARLRAAGIAATYHVCDLSNWEAVAKVLSGIRKRGPIRGIIHGAGFEAAAKIEKKKLALVERTIDAKAGGAAALLALTASDPLGWFIGFGSTSGRLGGIGQTDYSLANDMLAKQIDALRNERPACRATVFHWHAWDEIGMAARPESRFALESFGLRFMPPAEGVAYVLTELEAGLPEPEVMITEELLCPAQMHVANHSVAAQTVPSITNCEPQTVASTRDWESFLVGFVVEQTGYPAEIVELDADLEADLGIDSIKRAQLFGEIGERFALQADASLSLDDFPTLRHVMRYLEATVDGLTAAPSQTAISTSTTPSDISASPLISGTTSQPDGSYLAYGTLDPVHDVFLRDHRMLGRPVLPGVTGCELLAQAVSMRTPRSRYVRWKNVELAASLRFASDDLRAFDVRVDNAAATLCTAIADRRGSEEALRREHVYGEVTFSNQVSIPLPKLEQPPFPYNPMEYPDVAAMHHGPALRTLDGLMFQHGGGWGRLKSTTTDSLAGERAKAGWILPMAIIDGCIVGCAVYSWLMRGRRVEIPQGFGELWLLQDPQPEQTLQMQFSFLRADERNSWFDFDLFAEDGQPIALCRDLRLVKFGKDELA